MKLYKVGGCVRDQLMGLEPRDIDWLVVGSTPEQMIAQGFMRVGADFPVFLHPESKEEYALARKERKTSAGHKGFETVFDPTVTIEEDLSRRDLTINAMALDTDTGALVDPYGGQADLNAGILRHVSNAFSEDPLRVMRLARFQARTGFSVAAETFEICKAICANGDLRELSRERICSELRKLLESPNASQGMASLREMGALDSLSPGWATRLDDLALAAIENAAKKPLPEWCMVRLACCQNLSSKDSEAFLSDFRFPSETIRWSARLGMFCHWARSCEREPAGSAVELERLGAAKFSDDDRAAFGACALLELQASSTAPEAIASAMAALSASRAIADCDLSAALALPKKDIPAAVRQAKAEAFAIAWRAASDKSSPRIPRP